MSPRTTTLDAGDLSPQTQALLELTRDIADRELRPRAADHEARAVFPRQVFRILGRAGLLGLPYDPAHGGGGQPYQVYLRVLEELACAWLAVGLGVSVHTLACFPVHAYGTPQQRERFLPDMLGGELLGAYCLSEPQSGSDAAALTTRAVRDGEDYLVNGVKAWVTHAGQADFYNLMVRTSDDGPRGVSTLLADSTTPGLLPQPPEKKMGLSASPTAQIVLSDARVPADRILGKPGEGFHIALAALDAGRLGVAACAVGLARAALDHAVTYAGQRHQFGHAIADFQGVSFMLADMATQVEAARRHDAGQPFGTQAAMAKLFCTDTAMRVTTDAVQVLGGYGYVEDHPVERWMREAKVLQILEGTNQIQRLVIGRTLTRHRA